MHGVGQKRAKAFKAGLGAVCTAREQQCRQQQYPQGSSHAILQKFVIAVAYAPIWHYSTMTKIVNLAD
jgi:hypothetical protein